MWTILLACETPEEVEPTQAPLVVVTFNTGSGGDFDPDYAGDYGEQQARIQDEWYGSGLSWGALIDETRAWFASIDADIVALQEVFWPGACADIPEEAKAGFVCEGWQEGDPTVAEQILGEGWQVACNPGHPDKCLAVRERVGTWRGCEGPLCLDGLDGAEVRGCGSGARVGRGTIDRVDGGVLTVVGVHGTSGISASDQDCRLRQFTQIFEAIGEKPGENGQENLILGDFNTDPGRWADIDPSAAYVARQVTAPLQFVTEVGPDAPPTYLLANIDHVITDARPGDCVHPGLEGEAPVTLTGILDHRPAVCTIYSRH